MTARSKYRQMFQIRPFEHMLDLSYANPNQPLAYASFPSMNCVVTQRSVAKRPGLTLDRTMASTEKVQLIAWYQLRDKTTYTLMLTENDICKRNSTAYSYLTPQWTTGNVDTVTGTAVVGKSGTNWKTSPAHEPIDLPAAGDKFIINADYTSTSEPAADWATIAGVGTDTSITLTANYAHNKTTGTHAYTIRKIYTTPTDERWQYAVVANKFCFTNGYSNVQYWNGSSATAADLDPADPDATPAKANNAVKARYCLSFANRLILADMELSGQREPWTIKWSKNEDPTNWTDSTAGEADFIGTESFITGLGKVLNNILVYKHDSIIFGSRTGVATAPLQFPREIPGIGCIAPYSIIHALGTNFFLGNDDFYEIVSSDHAAPIGGKICTPIRDKFMSLVTKGDREKVWGMWSSQYRKLMWFANTADYGQLCFAYDYGNNEWECHKYAVEITGGGEQY